jgi:hypothetical protein
MHVREREGWRDREKEEGERGGGRQGDREGGREGGRDGERVHAIFLRMSYLFSYVCLTIPEMWIYYLLTVFVHFCDVYRSVLLVTYIFRTLLLHSAS